MQKLKSKLKKSQCENGTNFELDLIEYIIIKINTYKKGPKII